MSGDVSKYQALLTARYRNLPQFSQWIGAVAQAYADLTAAAQLFSALYDLDSATGAQLDAVGRWVGASRFLSVVLVNVAFSWDTDTLGWDEGNWDFDSSGNLTRLGDDDYRTLLRARILNNHWDGTVDKDPAKYVNGDINGQLLPNKLDSSAYAIWDALFQGTGLQLYIKDHGNLTMTLGLRNTSGMPISAVTQALFTGGYLNVKPAGISTDYEVT